ncbi:hypothetical protein K1719_025449 [Acacia pycnantha]|nr:hypothetical protein K1719_025449 [Acacia pycnantha]
MMAGQCWSTGLRLVPLVRRRYDDSPPFRPLPPRIKHEILGKLFRKFLPGLISSGSFLPLFILSLVDLPILVVALEKVEKSSGPLLGNGIASIQQNTAPKMLLALMDEAYLGSTIEDGARDSNPRIAVLLM